MLLLLLIFQLSNKDILLIYLDRFSNLNFMFLSGLLQPYFIEIPTYMHSLSPNQVVAFIFQLYLLSEIESRPPFSQTKSHSYSYKISHSVSLGSQPLDTSHRLSYCITG
jgi:hypothetical protein